MIAYEFQKIRNEAWLPSRFTYTGGVRVIRADNLLILLGCDFD